MTIGNVVPPYDWNKNALQVYDTLARARNAIDHQMRLIEIFLQKETEDPLAGLKALAFLPKMCGIDDLREFVTARSREADKWLFLAEALGATSAMEVNEKFRDLVKASNTEEPDG